MCRRCRATGVLIVPTPPKNSHRCTPLTAPAGVAKMKCSPTAASEAAAAAAAASATRPWDSAVTRATQQRRRCYRSSPCSQSTGSAVSPLAALNFICWSELLPLLPLQSHGANGGGGGEESPLVASTVAVFNIIRHRRIGVRVSSSTIATITTSIYLTIDTETKTETPKRAPCLIGQRRSKMTHGWPSLPNCLLDWTAYLFSRQAPLRHHRRLSRFRVALAMPKAQPISAGRFDFWVGPAFLCVWKRAVGIRKQSLAAFPPNSTLYGHPITDRHPPTKINPISRYYDLYIIDCVSLVKKKGLHRSPDSRDYHFPLPSPPPFLVI